MHPTYTTPTFMGERFNCPHCQAFAQMEWHELRANTAPTEFFLALCTSCRRSSVWSGSYENVENIMANLFSDGAMVFPHGTIAPHPHHDMPADAVPDFEEARQVLGHSPRSAAALLRLCIQKICNGLLGRAGKIDTQIGELVAQGLSRRAQQALDAVRVIGNESVHPGTMDLNDTPELAQALFRLVNLIVQDCISAPKEAEEVYSLLPAGKLKGIEQRDKVKP